MRTSTTVRFTAAGGDAQLLGTYFADDGQHIESRLLVDHAHPNCRSDVLYKVRCKRIRNPTVRTHTPSGWATC